MRESIPELSKVVASYFMESLVSSLENGKDISLLIGDVETFLLKVGAGAMSVLLEEADAIVREAPERNDEWEVQASLCETTLATVFGEVTYERTYYRSKGKTKVYMFLSDRILGIEAHDKTDLLLDSRMVEESVDTAYRKSGKKVTRMLTFTGQTVMNKIRDLGPVISVQESPLEKRKVKVLYIDADEDHVALQTGGRVEPRLVYVYEGKRLVTKELPKKGTPRLELIGKRCFGGVYEDYEELWLEVAKYIDETYDAKYLEKIYLSGDGAAWIRQGVQWIDKSVYVVYKYHLSKYVQRIGAYAENGADLIWEALYQGDKEYFKLVINTIEDSIDTPNKAKEIKEAKSYIKGVWDTLKYHNEPDYSGCSAEGHVSHIISSRLSSRPLGWSREGADQMTRLRIFRENGGNIYELMLSKKKQQQIEIKIKKQNARIQQMSKFAVGCETLTPVRFCGHKISTLLT